MAIRSSQFDPDRPWKIPKKCSWCGDDYSHMVAMGNSFETMGFCSEKCYIEKKSKDAKKETSKEYYSDPLKEALKPTNAYHWRLRSARLEEISERIARGTLSSTEAKQLTDEAMSEFYKEEEKDVARRATERAKLEEERREASAIAAKTEQQASQKIRNEALVWVGSFLGCAFLLEVVPKDFGMFLAFAFAGALVLRFRVWRL